MATKKARQRKKKPREKRMLTVQPFCYNKMSLNQGFWGHNKGLSGNQGAGGMVLSLPGSLTTRSLSPTCPSLTTTYGMRLPVLLQTSGRHIQAAGQEHTAVQILLTCISGVPSSRSPCDRGPSVPQESGGENEGMIDLIWPTKMTTHFT